MYLFCIPESDYVSDQTPVCSSGLTGIRAKEHDMPMLLNEREGAVALLTLNNPAQYNALGAELMRDLQAVLDQALADPTVRVLLLTGAGKGFCSGAPNLEAAIRRIAHVFGLLHDNVSLHLLQRGGGGGLGLEFHNAAVQRNPVPSRVLARVPAARLLADLCLAGVR